MILTVLSFKWKKSLINLFRDRCILSNKITQWHEANASNESYLQCLVASISQFIQHEQSETNSVCFFPKMR